MKFSLRTLFLMTLAMAFYLALVFAITAPVRLVAVATLTFLTWPAVMTGIIYDRGYGRTFWIGCSGTAIIPFLYIAYCFFQYPGELLIHPHDLRSSFSDEQIAYPLVGCHGLILLSGLTAVAVRWLLIESRTRHGSVSAASDSSTTLELEDSGP